MSKNHSKPPSGTDLIRAPHRVKEKSDGHKVKSESGRFNGSYSRSRYELENKCVIHSAWLCSCCLDHGV